MFARNALLARKMIFTISAGFALALALIVTMTVVGLYQLADTNARLEAIVMENNVKVRLANQMRDILRDRAISMLSIVVMNDPFEQDQEMMRFYDYGSAYQQVRLDLKAIISLPQEKEMLASIDALTRENQPVMVRVVDLATEGYTFLAFEALQKEAIPLQHQLVRDLDKLIQIQRQMTAEAAAEAHQAYVNTRWLMITLGVVALLVAALVAGAVVRRTARLAAESEREHTKFLTLFKTNSDGIVILDEGGFTDCNPATLEMFHMNRVEDFLKCRPEDLGVEDQPGGTPPYELAQRHIQEAVDKGHAFFQWIARRPDGTTFPAEIALHAMNLDGKVVIQAIMRDISIQKESEAALRDARDTALATTEMKSQFVANVSHEIRTPMNGIVGMAQLLLGSPLNPRQKEYAEAIARSAEALMGVINDLLDFSKIEAGRLTVEEVNFDLGTVLKDIIELYTPRADAKHLALRLERRGGQPAWVRGDPLRIRQILLNLLDNAIKFTQHGEVQLSVAAQGDAEQRIRFSVRDTGIGMTPEVQARIFQAFAQGDGSVSRKYGGTGLGLVISRQLAELMGGSLSLESTPGVGSTFHLVLPLPAARPMALKPQEPAPMPRFPGARVLVAEDNPVNQKLARFMLEHMEAQVLVAEDGRSAYELLEREPVDLVLMDCQMPEWDGLTAARAIRARERDTNAARVPIIALSANAMPGSADACRQAGMDGYLSKPLRAEILAATLARWLPEHAERRGAPAAADGSAAKLAPLLEPDTPPQLFQLEKVRRMCSDNRAQMEEVLRLFVSSSEALLADLASAIDARDGPQAARQAHQIKGAAAYLGAAAMADLAAQVESSAKQADWEAGVGANEDLEAAFIAVRLEIERFLGQA